MIGNKNLAVRQGRRTARATDDRRCGPGGGKRGGEEIFTNGIITGWRSGQQDGGDNRTPPFAMQSNNIRRDVDQKYVTGDYRFDLKWAPDSHWGVGLDYQHVDSTVSNLDVGLWGSTYQNLDLKLRGN